MFDKFPKKRHPLPKKYADIYTAYYLSNREGQTTASSLAQKMESWLHRQIASDITRAPDSTNVTLELGAGTLNQLQYEPSVRVYDIVEPFTELYQRSPLLNRVRNIYADISDVPNSCRYNRITSIATLEHVCNLPEVVARCGLLLADNGTFRASIPSEGTLLWTLGWKLTTGLEFKFKHGLDYGVIMKHEHMNTAQEIEEVLEYYFGEVKSKVYGLSKALSLYRYYEARNPRLERCRECLSTLLAP